MRCPSCHHSETKVIDSRSLNNGSVIRRRRKCLKCGFRFSTHEELELLNLYVVKKDGRREPYQREKLENGIRKACEKRPVSEKKLESLILDIEEEIRNTGDSEIPSAKIGQIVINKLKDFDEVAYIRFASVYKSFKDVETFEKELHSLLKKDK